VNAIVVIPTYNERQNISALIPAIQRALPDLHILVVDDNSPDGTGQAVLDLAADQGGKISLLSRPAKDGLAQAYSAGFKEALRHGFNSLALRQALTPRDPASADWWMLALAVIAILVCVWKMRPGPAILLAGLLYELIQHIRFQAIFAVLVVVLGGSLLPRLAELFSAGRVDPPDSQEAKSLPLRNPPSPVFDVVIFALFIALAACGLTISFRIVITLNRVNSTFSVPGNPGGFLSAP
jgi:glycosyltransferase involved in cell wall biosynthesis